jgi:trehalose 6-phosphate synthase
LLTTLPRHRQLVESVFAYDLVGFHTDEWLWAFESYVLGEAGGAWAADGRLQAFGARLKAGVFPIGLDFEAFRALATSPVANRAHDRMAANSVFRQLVVGVDRLDYSKGLEERLLGFERFLEDNPRLRREVLYLQIAPTSRGDVEAYKDLRARVDGLSGRINGAWADVDWTPIRYVHRNFRRDDLAGIYRAARVCLVTPMRDGMNLVAKEFVAAQEPDNPGVLVLSRFAGAARQMTDAVIVNPYSREEVSEALKTALTMGRGERIRRWERLFAGVRTSDVKVWRDSFVEALATAKEPALPLFPSPTTAILRDKAAEIQERAVASPGRAASRRIRPTPRRLAFRHPEF